MIRVNFISKKESLISRIGIDVIYFGLLGLSLLAFHGIFIGKYKVALKQLEINEFYYKEKIDKLKNINREIQKFKELKEAIASKRDALRLLQKRQRVPSLFTWIKEHKLPVWVNSLKYENGFYFAEIGGFTVNDLDKTLKALTESGYGVAFTSVEKKKVELKNLNKTVYYYSVKAVIRGM